MQLKEYIWFAIEYIDKMLKREIYMHILGTTKYFKSCSLEYNSTGAAVSGDHLDD